MANGFDNLLGLFTDRTNSAHMALLGISAQAERIPNVESVQIHPCAGLIA